MSKPLKLLLKSFNKEIGTASSGSYARDFSSIFVSEKCDIFIMQNARMQPGASSNDTTVGAITRRFENTAIGPPPPTYSLCSWFPPYFFEAVRTEVTTATNFLCDKFTMSPSIPFGISNSQWFQVPAEAGAPSGTKTGLHVTTLNNGSGQNIIIGSYMQNANNNSPTNVTNFTYIINQMIAYAGNSPFIMCCNLMMNRTETRAGFINSNGVGTCDFNNGDNPYIKDIFQSGTSQYMDSGLYFISKGLAIDVQLLPLPSFVIPPTYLEPPGVIITINNFIIANPNNPYYANTISEFFMPGGSLTNRLTN